MIDPAALAQLRKQLHDFRNQLSAILPNAQLIAESAVEVRDMAEAVVLAAKQLRGALDAMEAVLEASEREPPP